MRASAADVAVEYTAANDGPTGTLWLPFTFLADCEAKKDEPVTLEAASDGRVAAQWRDRSVPQLVQYEAVTPPDPAMFPATPDTFTPNLPQLLKALVHAGSTTDSNAVRFAVNCIQLQGQRGSLAATDGRQLLVQEGFHFPWTDDLLIPSNRVFASPELPDDQPVQVGMAGDWVAFRVGPWTIWLAINKEGRFPDVEREIRQPAAAVARLQISPADAEFLSETLPRLPCNDVYNSPITVDLNGSIAIRGRGTDQAKATEVVLTGSEWSGEPTRLNMNRSYLARALKLGFQELCAFSDKAPVACFDSRRKYVWALLDPDSAIRPADDAVRIESARPAAEIPNPKPKRKVSPVPEPTTTPQNGQANGKAKSNGHAAPSKAERQDLAALIEEAEALRQSLRDTLAKTNELVKGLKRHRRVSRNIESTLGALRQLKTLGV